MGALLLSHSETSPSLQEVETPIPVSGEARVVLKAAVLNHRELWIFPASDHCTRAKFFEVNPANGTIGAGGSDWESLLTVS